MSSESVLDSKIDWLINVANAVKSHFLYVDKPTIIDIIDDYSKETKSVFISDTLIADGYEYLLLSSQPYDDFISLTDHLKKNKIIQQNRESFNPIVLSQRLIKQPNGACEYLFDIAGARMVYGINARYPCDLIGKIIGCRNVSFVKNYFKYIDDESFMLKKDAILSLKMDTDIIVGGKKKKGKTNMQQTDKAIRIAVLDSLFKYISTHHDISHGLIVINKDNDSPATLSYMDYKYKDAIHDFLVELVKKDYKNFSIKTFLHAEFNVPYDFRMKKHSCMLINNSTKNNVYIANLYNIASYDPIPCTRDIVYNKGNRDDISTFLNIAHPIVHLRFLYIDMYLTIVRANDRKKMEIEVKQKYKNRVDRAYNECLTFINTPIWLGVYIDESYDHIKANNKVAMKEKVNMSPEVFFI